VKAFSRPAATGNTCTSLRNDSKTVSVRKPAASRPESAEVYLLARGLNPIRPRHPN